MIKHDFAPRDKIDPVEVGDKVGTWIACIVLLFACHYLIFWLAGGQ